MVSYSVVGKQRPIGKARLIHGLWYKVLYLHIAPPLFQIGSGAGTTRSVLPLESNNHSAVERLEVGNDCKDSMLAVPTVGAQSSLAPSKLKAPTFGHLDTIFPQNTVEYIAF